MKKMLAVSFCALLVVAGVAFVAQAGEGKTHEVEAEVVSTDASAKTLTIKGDPNKTVPVEAAAATQLSNVKAGDKVKLTCRDNEEGEHQAVVKIEKAEKQ